MCKQNNVTVNAALCGNSKPEHRHINICKKEPCKKIEKVVKVRNKPNKQKKHQKLFRKQKKSLPFKSDDLMDG